MTPCDREHLVADGCTCSTQCHPQRAGVVQTCCQSSSAHQKKIFLVIYHCFYHQLPPFVLVCRRLDVCTDSDLKQIYTFLLCLLSTSNNKPPFTQRCETDCFSIRCSPLQERWLTPEASPKHLTSK